jgi:UDP-GlcNAc:undecaprenyl-phosphate GlcNAc-1-phosphate transferase
MVRAQGHRRPANRRETHVTAVLIVVMSGVVIKYVPFTGLDPLPAHIAVPLTTFVLVGITNAINLADGLDGLASGTSLLSLGIIAMLAYMTDHLTVIFIAVSVVGGILGFLRFNTYPPRIFMGDSGSQFLGFSAGVLVVMLTQQNDSALSVVLPVMILGLPIVDTLLVMGQRLYEARSLFLPDKNHIHHRLLVLGFDHYEAVFVIYLLQSILVC